MFKRLFEHRKYFAVITAVVLAIQSVLPTSLNLVRPALAAETTTWAFNDAGDYTLDPALDIVGYLSMADTLPSSGDGFALHFKFNEFSDVGPVGIDTPIATIMRSDIDNRLWATSGARVYYSANYGAIWVPESSPLFAGGVTVKEIINAGSNLIAMGDHGAGDFFAAYSTNGTDWLPSAVAGGVPANDVLGVTWDGTTAYALTSDALVYKSTTGEIWEPAKSTINVGDVTSPKDIVAAGTDRILISGAALGTGAITFTTNGWSTWGSADIPGTPADITTLHYVVGRVYAGTTNYLASITGTGDYSVEGQWSNLSTNINAGTFASGIKIFAGQNSNIVFAGVNTGASYRLYSSLSSGTAWYLHYDTGVVTKVPSGGWVWTDSGDQLIYAGANGGGPAVMAANPAPAGTSVILNTALSGVGTITNITATAQALSYGEVKMSFGTVADDAATWHYYDGAAWTTSTTDNASAATTVSTLTTEVLAGLPLTGAVYIKLYPPATTSTLVLETLSVTYDPPGGLPPAQDQTAPSSQVDAMTEYTGVNACGMTLNVTATATDGQGSGVASVQLFRSTDGVSFIAYEQPDTEAPYSWSVPVEHGQIYYFYTIATDNGQPPNTEAPPVNPGWDTFTTIDAVSPGLLSNYPEHGQRNVALTAPIVLNFSEPIVPESFYYRITYTYLGGEFNGNASAAWSNNNQTVTISHDPFSYYTGYTVEITAGTDRAGNPLVNELSWCEAALLDMPPMYRPLDFSFTTMPRQDPDLRESRLLVADGPNSDGSYNPGNNATYTLHLENTSTMDADNITATIMFAPGISFVSAEDARFRTIAENGTVVGLEWAGSLTGLYPPPYQGFSDNIVDAVFTMQVDNPATSLTISQSVTINDGINPPFVPEPPAVLYVKRAPVYTTSTKTVDKDMAWPSDILTYTITVRNTGGTTGDVEITDYVPKQSNESGQPLIFFKPGSITYNHSDERWSVPPDYNTNTETIRGVALDVESGSSALTFSFQAVVRGSANDVDIVNTAYVWDPNIVPNQKTTLTASTRVPCPPGACDLPPLQISYQSPTPGTNNNALAQNIEVGFNSQVDLDRPFDYEFYEGDEQVTGDWLAAWTPTWSDFNGKANALFTLTPSEGELAVGAIYTIVITSATNTDGNTLDGQPVSWSFTTADPVVKITAPDVQLYELAVNTLSTQFVVTLTDSISGKLYLAETDISIGLRAYLGSIPRGSGSFWKDATHQLGVNPKITISQGQSIGTFYYKDSEVSTPDYITIRAFEDPWKGWADSEKYVTITGDIPPADELVLNMPLTVTAGTFSSQSTITARDEWGRAMNLPSGRLYFFSGNTTGAFYDNQHRKLPYLVTVQALGDNAPQYVDLDGTTSSLNFYYLDSQAGTNQIAIADNNPLWPDTGLNDVSAILTVQIPPEEDLIKELEDVEDDSGRVIDRIVLTPTQVALLPGKTQAFEATAYDTDNKKIDIAKFGWFVLIEQSGTMERGGDDETTAVSTFTASENLGKYPDTVLVASLYNGQLAYATASVDVVDVVDYRGPKRLPVTGMNGLQLVLMALTLAAAVALAWVEHYDKTHFKAAE